MQTSIIDGKEYVFFYQHYPYVLTKSEKGKQVKYSVKATQATILYRNTPGDRTESLKQLSSGEAKCSPKDTFNRKVGRKLAFTKAIQNGKDARVIDKQLATKLWQAFFVFTPLTSIYKSKYNHLKNVISIEDIVDILSPLEEMLELTEEDTTLPEDLYVTKSGSYTEEEF